MVYHLFIILATVHGNFFAFFWQEDLCFHPTKPVLAVALRHAKQHIKLLPVPAQVAKRGGLSDAHAPKPLASLSSGLHSK